MTMSPIHRLYWFLAIVAAMTASAPASAAGWEKAYDLDGDGKRDEIIGDFSGGAHCCYRFGARLSSNGKTIMLPFEMDGGYQGGEDLLSKPDQFTIRTPPSGLPELVMKISTYNGKPYPLERKWMRRYGIRTHHVAICFRGGRVRVRDWKPQLPPCPL
jgi:hypothetical protein